MTTGEQADLLAGTAPAWRPLADRMRPRTLDEYVGQVHLLSPGKPLREAIERGRRHSMIFWGPPGSGKTTLARLLAAHWQARFLTLSAVSSGARDIRAAVDTARAEQAASRPTVLFVDEVHRFNKAQQDGFLPYVEDGTLVLVGATTENPSFELNKSLLSRARVYRLRRLEPADLESLLEQALEDGERGLGGRGLGVTPAARELLVSAADGDGRRLLNLLEMATDLVQDADAAVVDEPLAREVATRGGPRFDKRGDDFYDLVSALQKSIRGSSPDAALYWLARMLEGGCDPGYAARRLLRTASEDVGNADPRALQVVLSAWDAYDRLGSPEGELALAQAVVYLACAPKSNAVYTAWNEATADAGEGGSLEVPMSLRNAPTSLMRAQGHGRGYRYAHDEPGGYAAGARYLPDALEGKRYYRPVERGLEIRIAERLRELARLDREAREEDES